MNIKTANEAHMNNKTKNRTYTYLNDARIN